MFVAHRFMLLFGLQSLTELKACSPLAFYHCAMEINKNASKFQDTFKCGDCGFVAIDNGGLKIHTDMHLKLKCDQFNFKAADFKGLRTHKLSCFVSCRICKHQVETTEKMKKHMKALHNEVLTAY